MPNIAFKTFEILKDVSPEAKYNMIKMLYFGQGTDLNKSKSYESLEKMIKEAWSAKYGSNSLTNPTLKHLLPLYLTKSYHYTLDVYDKLSHF